MARGRGGKGPDKSNKLRRRNFSRNAFKRPPNKKRGAHHGGDKAGVAFRRKPRSDDEGGGGEWSRRGGLGPGRMPARPPPVPPQEPDSESSEEELSPLDQLLATFNVGKAKAVDSDDGSEDEENGDSMDEGEEEEEEEILADSDIGEEEILADSDIGEEEILADSDIGEEEAGHSEPADDDDEVSNDEGSDAERDASSESEMEASEGEVKETPTAVDDEPSDDSEAEEETDVAVGDVDPYTRHFGKLLDEPEVAQMSGGEQYWHTTTHKWPSLGRFIWKRARSDTSPTPPSTALDKDANLKQLCVQTQLHAGWKKSNSMRAFGGETLSPLQREIFSVANNYTDLLFYGRTHENSETIRSIYCLHALNHVLKTRLTVRRNSARLGKCDDVPDECRDQGLTRPKVLIVVPFREAALRVVRLLGSILLSDERSNVLSKKRFQEEFGGAEDDVPKEGAVPKPPDHLATFAGNIDDSFTVGVGVARKALRLYADFYSSDIIIASPLALRIAIGAPGDKKRDHDFMSSIELLIIDQADVLLMQNWEHMLHVLNHLHLQPRQAHGVDFSRVRPWVLEGWGQHYRQTLVFTSFASAEVNSIFTRHCSNYAGLVRTMNLEKGGAIQQVLVQIPQSFQRFQSSSPCEDPDARFNYFVSHVLPQFQEAVMSRTLIYVASYFDFVRLRNYMNRLEMSFVQISEYHSRTKVTEARNRFFSRRGVQFALYTERAHFFNRYNVKGIRHLIFYQLPSFPHFYSEMCNLTQLQQTHHTREITCTVMFSRYDAQRLAAVVGFDRTSKMLSSDKNVHLLITGETK